MQFHHCWFFSCPDWTELTCPLTKTDIRVDDCPERKSSMTLIHTLFDLCNLSCSCSYHHTAMYFFDKFTSYHILGPQAVSYHDFFLVNSINGAAILKILQQYYYSKGSENQMDANEEMLILLTSKIILSVLPVSLQCKLKLSLLFYIL
jgi:hypothetical protein